MVITRRDSAKSGAVLGFHQRPCRSVTRRKGVRKKGVEKSKCHDVGKEEENKGQNKRKDGSREG